MGLKGFILPFRSRPQGADAAENTQIPRDLRPASNSSEGFIATLEDNPKKCRMRISRPVATRIQRKR